MNSNWTKAKWRSQQECIRLAPFGTLERIGALQRHNTKKFKTNNPRKRIARPQSQFPQSFMCMWAIYIFPRSVCLFCCRRICGPILGIYKSLTDTWMCKLGLTPRNSFSGNTYMGFPLQCASSQCECVLIFISTPVLFNSCSVLVHEDCTEY
jgi:hypothetical protein